MGDYFAGPAIQLSPEQLLAYNQQAGFQGSAAVDMTAIDLAESGGHPTEVNDTPATGDFSVGDAQINYYDGLGPARTARYGPWSSLLDPLHNAQAAYDISSQGRNFTPWSTFKSGAFRSFLAQVPGAGATPGATPAPSSGPAGPASPAVAATNVFDPFGIGGDLKSVAFTGIFMLLGVGLVVAGAWQAVSPTVHRVGEQAAQAGPVIAAAA